MNPDTEKRYAKLMEIASQKMAHLQAEVDALKQAQAEPIAVIGMGCRFPGGADTPAQLWQVLRRGVDTIAEPPPERWALIGVEHPHDLPQLLGGFIANVDHFDAQFFGISPREAVSLDPQQRLLLEICWEALEHAGIAPDSVFGSATGVFMGITASDYQYLFSQVVETGAKEGVYLITGNSLSAAAGRISYTLGLTGPAVATDTSCSSSLVAVHQACQSLRSRECDLALAGGVSLMLRIDSLAKHFAGQVFAPDGRCKAFDTAANSFGRGEGCGVVVLKRLSDAMSDNDNIIAVIQGSMINQDGRTNGMTAPNGSAQQSVIRQALQNSRVDPAQVGYVEAHGTGTSIGDPVEIEALNAVFRRRSQPLWVGSIKTNMGHLEGAAGIAGLMKAVLAVHYGEIPPNLHFNHPNPYIDWESSPIQIPTELTPWPKEAGQRVAGVSSFGFSGTNAHIVLAETPAAKGQGRRDTKEPEMCLLPLSAKNDQALRDLAQKYIDHLSTNPQADLADICYTAQTGRAHFGHRLSITANSLADAQSKLAGFVGGQSTASVSRHSNSSHRSAPKIAFLFTGQGSQYENMGQDLYKTQLVFRQAIEQCDEILRPYLEQSLISILYPNKSGGAQGSSIQSKIQNPKSKINQTAFTQPALFALEYALAQLWQSWGIKPNVVMGHSVGEIVAACVAGVFSLEDGLKLAAFRGRLMQSLPKAGAMVAVMADETQVKAALAPYQTEVAVAALNGPQNVVISGRRDAVEKVIELFDGQAIQTRRLNVSHAFHSPLMEPILLDFESVVRELTLNPPKINLISNLTGQLATDDITTPDYWVRHIRQPVRFADSMATLENLDTNIFIEIGPQPTLLSMARQIDSQSKIQNLPSNEVKGPKSKILWLPSLRNNRNDTQQMLESLGNLYVRGCKINWTGVNQKNRARKVALPTYPFQRQSYWIKLPTGKRARENLRPLIDRMINLPEQQQTVFETEFSVDTVPFLADHRIYNTVVSPGAAHLSMVLSAAQLAFGSSACQIAEAVLPAPLIIPNEERRTVQIILTAAGTESGATATGAVATARNFRLISFDANNDIEKPTTHAQGQVMTGVDSAPEQIRLESLQKQCSHALDIDALYALSARHEVMLGPSFRWLDAVWRDEDSDNAPAALGKLRLPPVVGQMAGYVIHPGLLDACFQVAGLAHPPVTAKGTAPSNLWLPFAVDKLQLYQPATGVEWWCYAKQAGATSPEPAGTVAWDIRLLDPDGQLIADIRGLKVRAASSEAMLGAEPWRNWLYKIEWQPKPIFGLRPDYLASPTQIQQTISNRPETFPALPPDFPGRDGLQRYKAAMKQLDAVSVNYILTTFAAAGVLFKTSNADLWRTEQIAKRLGVIPQYHRLLERMLDILAEVGILQPEANGWRVLSPQTQPDALHPGQQIDVLLQQYGDIAGAELAGLKRCGEKLGEVLRGLQNPLLLLFPDDESAETRARNQKSPAIQVMSRQIQQVVLAAIKHLPAERGIRLLEVGAGTGSATAWLLPHLPPRQTDYVFTDISPAFIPTAREQFATYDFVHYTTFNLEQSPLEQSFGPHQYDIVVAANVLHATRDLQETLAHIRQVLAPDGLLILLEVTRPSYGVDLTFGLTDGWWRFDDTRTNYPLLDKAEWETLLLENGFDTVSVIQDHYADEAQLGQTVFVARSGQNITLQSQLWLIFADEAGVGETLAAELDSRGQQSILVYSGHNYHHANAGIFHINPTNPADYRQLLKAVPNVYGVVHLWSLAQPAIETTVNLEKAALQGCGSALYLTQAIIDARLEVGVWLVTEGAQAVIASDPVGGFAQSSLWGLGRVIGLENPQLTGACIDLDRSTGDVKQQAATLCAELLTVPSPQFRENQVAFRRGIRYAARLADYQAEPGATGESFQLEIRGANTLDNLKLYPAPRRTPAAGEVELKVRATGLNFIDVLDALGLLPFERMGGLGGECAGEVVAVGEGVDSLHIGDWVVAMAPGCFSKYVTVPAALALALPDNLSFEDAATIPANFLTAYQALHQVAHISSGDRVLIHAAAGGTGMAAVRLAQQAGAEIFATAGPGKWSALEALGIKHIYNSRTLDFADQIMADTNGQGVDIVLNSLTGDGFIEKGISVLAPQGRFLEIAKINVWDADRVQAIRPDISYHLVDLPLDPDQLRPIFETLMTQFETETLKPLPYTPFPIQDAVEAFRFMQQAKHIGKIVLTQPGDRQVDVRADASYLITGGLSGLGLLVARWLVEQGARYLVLVGRSQPEPEAQAQLSALAELGADVIITQADVTDLSQMRAALAQIDDAHPLRGVVHSVGVLDNAVLPRQTWERFTNVLNPKVMGAWNLHQLTREQRLDFFVLFSSAVGMLGNRGQANHAAANAFLDAFAAYRRGQGLPALSIAWGAWSQVGAAAEMVQRTRQQMAAHGLGTILPTRGIETFAYLLNQDVAHAGVLPIDWPKFLANADEATITLPLLATYQQQVDAYKQQPIELQINFRHELETTPPEKRADVLMQHLHNTLAKVLGLDSGNQIDPHQGLMDMGLDSLMAIEMRNYLINNLNIKIPPTALFDYPTLAALNKYLLNTMFEPSTKETVETKPSLPALPQDDSHLDNLSQNELAALLAQELESLKEIDD